MDLEAIAKRSTEVRFAASCADNISMSLHKLNAGPVFDHERDKLLGEVSASFRALAGALGYTLAEHQS